jgi:hypothetical protein
MKPTEYMPRNFQEILSPETMEEQKKIESTDSQEDEAREAQIRFDEILAKICEKANNDEEEILEALYFAKDGALQKRDYKVHSKIGDKIDEMEAVVA